MPVNCETKTGWVGALTLKTRKSVPTDAHSELLDTATEKKSLHVPESVKADRLDGFVELETSTISNPAVPPATYARVPEIARWNPPSDVAFAVCPNCVKELTPMHAHVKVRAKPLPAKRLQRSRGI